MVITLIFNLSKEGVSEVHFVIRKHLFTTHCSIKVLQDGAVNDLNLKAIVKFDITNGFLRCSFLLSFNAFHMPIWLQ